MAPPAKPTAGFVAMRDLKTPSDVARAIRGIGPGVQARHVTAAFRRLAQMSRDEGRKAMRSVAEAGLRTVGSAGGDDVAGVLEACARMGFRHGLLGRLARRAVEKRMAAEMGSDRLTALITAVCVLTRRGKDGIGGRENGKRRKRAEWAGKPEQVDEKGKGRGGGEREKDGEIGTRRDSGVDPLQGVQGLDQVSESCGIVAGGELGELDGEGMGHGEGSMLGMLLKVACDELLLFRERDKCIEANLPRLLSFMAASGHKDQRLVDGVVAMVSCPNRAAHLEDGQLTNALCGLEKLGFKDEAVLDVLCAEVTDAERMGAFHKAQLFAVVVSLSRLASKLGSMRKFCLAALKEASEPGRLASYTGVDFIVVLGIAAQHGLSDVGGMLFQEFCRRQDVIVFSDQQKSLALKAITRLASQEPQLVSKMVDSLLEKKGEENLSDSALVSVLCIWTTQQCQHLPQHRDAIRALCKKVCTPSRLSRLSTGDLARVIHVLYRCQKLDDPLAATTELQPVVQEAAQRARLISLNAVDLSALMSSLGLARISAVEPAVKLVLHEVCTPSRLRKFERRQLMNVVHNFGSLPHTRDFTSFDKLSLSYLESELLRPHRLHSFSQGDVAVVLHGLARIGQPSRRAVSAFCAKLLEGDRTSELRQSEVLHIFTALRMLNVRDEGLAEVLIDVVLSDQGLRSFTEHGLTGILYSLAHMGYDDERVWNEIVGELTRVPRLQKLGPHGFSDIFKSMRLVGFRDAASVDLLVGEMSKPNRLQDFDPEHLFWITQDLKRLVGGSDAAIMALQACMQQK
ncbi:unnamed protein product [Ostreobium quekettii]|uniref:Uncharacterized protein n=1 Tax=Ostreobium quekettii TaxID=121088 RepID=A0A8S1J377_9CHLO|nr:unnamed protein product [Ostreobium quekettii]